MANGETKVVWIDREYTAMKKEPQRRFKEKYKELGIKTGDFEIIEQVTRVRSRQEDTKVKIIKITHDRATEDIYKKLQSLRLEVGPRDRVIMHDIEGVDIEKLKRMVKYTICHILQQSPRLDISPGYDGTIRYWRRSRIIAEYTGRLRPNLTFVTEMGRCLSPISWSSCTIGLWGLILA